MISAGTIEWAGNGVERPLLSAGGDGVAHFEQAARFHSDVAAAHGLRWHRALAGSDACGMRFDPQCGYTEPESPKLTTAHSGGSGPGATAGKAVAAAAVILTALLGAWIWQQQMPGVEQADAATALTTPPVGQRDAAWAGSESNENAEDSDEVKRAPSSDELNSDDEPAQTYSFDIDDSDAARAFRSESLLNQGKEELAMGRTNRAIELLEEAVRLDPDSAEAHYNLGLGHVLHGDMAAARRERDLLRELDPNLSSLLGNLVR